ncbi:hypothetical protein [Aliiroseovarius sp. F20344]|uniref:hypothetical protein n=1 Tax=Aliiroseovarius sp. F20344 TaxID=2926414 RepID=UPI001FF46A3D|nr:hypothetical protein [Aliiroseovarius sp. F20344]MCK0143543.1 hypothetical protein [Aliiroseovarius sp. F20344]
MVVIVALVLGAVFGVLRAKKRGGNRLDMAQYGAVYGIGLALIVIFLVIIGERNLGPALNAVPGDY